MVATGRGVGDHTRGVGGHTRGVGVAVDRQGAAGVQGVRRKQTSVWRSAGRGRGRAEAWHGRPAGSAEGSNPSIVCSCQGPCSRLCRCCSLCQPRRGKKEHSRHAAVQQAPPGMRKAHPPCACALTGVALCSTSVEKKPPADALRTSRAGWAEFQKASVKSGKSALNLCRLLKPSEISPSAVGRAPEPPA